jgi:hypothetical protein
MLMREPFSPLSLLIMLEEYEPVRIKGEGPRLGLAPLPVAGGVD